MQNPLIPKHRLSGTCYLIEDKIYMKRILPSLLLILTASFNIQSVYAQESSEPELQKLPQEDREAAREARREQIQNMTAEERAAAREQVKARRESMTDEQRAAVREQVRARRENMTDEQRAAMQNRRQERRANGEGMRGNRGGADGRPGRRN